MHGMHARTFFLSDFVSIENTRSTIQIPKLDVAGSIPLARPNLLSTSRKVVKRNFKLLIVSLRLM
jgi:hypothetical protein